MAAQKLTIRLYKKGDEHLITSLFRDIFGREMSLEEWRWKYFGEDNEKVYSSIAVSGTGELVAHYGGMVHRMVFNHREIRGLSIGDVMVHPNFRGTKLFKKVALIVPEEAVQDGIVLGYGFPNQRAMLLPEKLGLYEKVEDVWEAYKETLFNNSLIRYIYKLFPLGYDEPRIDILWKSAAKGFGLSVIRDRNYLDWRYRRHPFFKYEMWGFKSRFSNRLLGMVVLRRDNDKMLIIDFICEENMLKPLFQKTENYAVTCGFKNISLWLPEYLSKKMEEIGFSIRLTGTCIPRTTHEKTLKKDEIKGRFFYTMGDTDFM
jgi:GNAT superfamily N-acetyltransferase